MKIRNKSILNRRLINAFPKLTSKVKERRNNIKLKTEEVKSEINSKANEFKEELNEKKGEIKENLIQANKKNNDKNNKNKE